MTQEEMKNDWLIAVSEIIEAISKLGSDENTGEHLSVVKSRSKRLLKDASNVLDVEEPEFKVRDYIATKRFIGVISRVDKVPTDDDCDLYAVGGLFYDKYLESIGNTRLFPSDYLGSGRIPTKEEIAEYKAALTFREHGRKPFEVKEDDIISNADGKTGIVLYVNKLSKEDFITGGYKLLKTADEYREWLGADNE